MHNSNARSAPGLFYVPGRTALHRANPLTKLAAFVWVGSAAAVLPTAGTTLLTLMLVALAGLAGVGRRVSARLLVAIVPLALALCVVQGVLISRPDAHLLGPVAVSPTGLAYAAKLLARIAAVVAGSLLLVVTTHPAAIVKALDARGTPPAISYLIASPLLLLEPLANRANEIQAAQRVRGLDLSSTWFARISALPMLLFPLITLALTDLDHRVLVLNGRAFRAAKRRTVLDPPADSTGQYWFRRIVLVLAVLQLGLLFAWR